MYYVYVQEARIHIRTHVCNDQPCHSSHSRFSHSRGYCCCKMDVTLLYHLRNPKSRSSGIFMSINSQYRWRLSSHVITEIKPSVKQRTTPSSKYILVHCLHRLADLIREGMLNPDRGWKTVIPIGYRLFWYRSNLCPIVVTYRPSIVLVNNNKPCTIDYPIMI